MASPSLPVAEHPFLLPTRSGNCLCIYRVPGDRTPIGTILHLPAFGDEMNKARAMTARAARAFASQGYGVLQIDLSGCGDSAGEHEDATVSRWLSDLDDAIAWLASRLPRTRPPILWALRFGALLAGSLLSRSANNAPLLLWQPVLSGAQYLTHLLRQKTISEMDNASARVGMAALRERLAVGETLEIGGYGISARLAADIVRLEFDVPAAYCGRIDWLEVVSSQAPALSTSATSRASRLRDAGARIDCIAVPGPGFWQSVEIERCDTLIEASMKALAEHARELRRDSTTI